MVERFLDLLPYLEMPLLRGAILESGVRVWLGLETFMVAQKALEGQKYVTNSLLPYIIHTIREEIVESINNTDSARMKGCYHIELKILKLIGEVGNLALPSRKTKRCDTFSDKKDCRRRRLWLPSWIPGQRIYRLWLLQIQFFYLPTLETKCWRMRKSNILFVSPMYSFLAEM